MNQNLCMVPYRKHLSFIWFLKIIKIGNGLPEHKKTQAPWRHSNEQSTKVKKHFSCHRTQTTDTNLESNLSNEKNNRIITILKESVSKLYIKACQKWDSNSIHLTTQIASHSSSVKYISNHRNLYLHYWAWILESYHKYKLQLAWIP